MGLKHFRCANRVLSQTGNYHRSYRIVIKLNAFWRLQFEHTATITTIIIIFPFRLHNF